MADAKITALTENTTPLITDIIPIVDDPAGTPATQKITLANLAKAGFLNSKVISATRDQTASSGDVAYTGVGFTPTAIMAIATTGGGGGAGAIPASWGFADSAKTMGVINTEGTAVFDIEGGYLILLYKASDANSFQLATVKTYDADGFTLTWTKAGTPTGTANIRFLCFR